MKIKQRALSILLSLVMVLTFMPAMTFAGTETDPDPAQGGGEVEEQSEDPYVTDLSFTPVDNGARFTFYENSTGYEEEADDGSDFWYYPAEFEKGDKLEVKYNTGATESLTYKLFGDEGDDDAEYKWVTASGDESLYTAYLDSDQYVNHWTAGDKEFFVSYGYDENGDEATISVTAHVLPSPVSKIEFEPSAASAVGRFTFYEGEEYDFDWEPGDKVVATINGTKVEYTAAETEDEDYVFYDDDGEEPQIGDIDYDYNSSTWTVGTDNFVTISYGGQTCKVSVEMLENPVASVSFQPKKTSYSVAELIRNEGTDDRYDNDDVRHEYYYYSLDFMEGDKMVLTMADEEASVKEYEFKGVDRGDDSLEDVFVASDGEELDWEYLEWPEYECEEEGVRISAGEYPFTGKYKGKEFTATITVTESSDEEIALEEARIEARRTLDDLDETINYSKYRPAQQDELENAYYKAQQAINNARSKADINNAIEAFKREVASVKTDEQLKREEEAARKAREAEAERQGTQTAGMPKMKFKKTTAKKTSIKVQWKKLNKKQLKKSKTTHYEIWVSANSAFPKGPQTKEYIVKKSKGSVNVKGLSKNTKYFVKIRAIKYVGGKKQTGPWKQKKVKTKKK